MPSVQPGLYAIVDRDACLARGLEPLAVARAFCTVPLSALQLRAKRATDRDRVGLARAVAAVARAAGIPFLVNDRADIARLAGADGVHLGQDDLPPGSVRRWLGPDRMIGLSTHDLGQVGAAAAEPVDYLGFGPVFATSTKERPSPVVGLDGLRAAVARSAHPIVAIGGIRLEDLPAVRAAGARSVALVSALLDGNPAERAARAVRLLLG
ncbi:MAG: thiamine phosphate synthase [Deltaproteobacteria bacterium]|nr:thiamine phosphate synthase [Deltaproteobacteria bacterium]